MTQSVCRCAVAQYHGIIFDLDGTLVDSAPAILSCFAEVLAIRNVVPVVPLTSAMIGPPLLSTLAALTGLHDVDLLASLADDFRQIYDHRVAELTEAYPGIEAMLAGLHGAGLQLLLATNKRWVPTERLLAAKGWQTYFTDVLTLDREVGSVRCKADVLTVLMQRHGLSAPHVLMVGDTEGDHEAAYANHIDYAHVAWGYGEPAVTLPAPNYWLAVAGSLLP